MKWTAIALLIACSGCGLFGTFRKQRFDAGKAGVLTLQVPKGYHKKALLADSAGNRRLVFSYPFGAELFFSTDTLLSAYIDTAQHLVKPHLPGGRFYKGMLPRFAFWREVYSQGLKYGYRNVHVDDEPLFDSALNYVQVR